MNFDAFEKKVKDLGVLGIVVTKDGKRPSDHVPRTGKSGTDGCTASGL